ncbi:MAG: hypothetical protein ACE5LB_11430 [Acidiferrobacterales bacterium]
MMKTLCKLFMHGNGSVALFLLMLFAISGDVSLGLIGTINFAIALAFHTQLVSR